MNGIATNFADLLEDDPEVLPLRGARAEGAGHVFPGEKSWTNRHTCPSMLFICRSHLLYNTNLFHKKAGTGPCKAISGSGHTEALVIPKFGITNLIPKKRISRSFSRKP